ncbi:MAG: hypothetical protein AVDCRST_MAG56-909 [uncultured Cytophagales bacterium]|uniref:GLPGLI family protein n=1 Tax=uncultured Cytophagales bacterium TaxID=158755 RepID=A0A6J4HNU4_9SPHI|nr:MAG: hypothetical protein AVDCRST_MAG56-909 [uncultured Cytophagales bacterium]
MKTLLCTACLVLLAVAARAQGVSNTALKKELDSLFAVDQQYRKFVMNKDLGGKADSLAQALNVPREQLPDYLGREMMRLDASNLQRLEQIMGQYGYPGKTLVGEPTNVAAFYIIQHSPKIKQYIPLIEAAARKGELPFYEYAKMQDRLLMQEGKEQIYGTQGRGFVTKGADGRPGPMQMFIWPIKDPKNVNQRRKEAGFTDTVEENARRLGIEYKVMTLEEAKALEKK